MLLAWTSENLETNMTPVFFTLSLQLLPNFIALKSALAVGNLWDLGYYIFAGASSLTSLIRQTSSVPKLECIFFFGKWFVSNRVERDVDEYFHSLSESHFWRILTLDIRWIHLLDETRKQKHFHFMLIFYEVVILTWFEIAHAAGARARARLYHRWMCRKCTTLICMQRTDRPS